jgi:hypothetical protein
VTKSRALTLVFSLLPMAGLVACGTDDESVTDALAAEDKVATLNTYPIAVLKKVLSDAGFATP